MLLESERERGEERRDQKGARDRKREIYRERERTRTGKKLNLCYAFER